MCQPGDRSHHLARRQSDVVLQEQAGGAKVRADHRPRQFPLAELLHPSSAIATAACFVTITDRHMFAVDPVFLEMIVDRTIRPSLDRSAAVWAALRGRYENQLVERRGPWAIPTGMAHRRSAFLALRGRVRFLLGRLLLPPLELLLTLGRQFPLALFDARGEFLDLVVLGRVLLAQGVILPMKRIGPLGLSVRSIDQQTQRRAAQMRTSANMRAAKLVLRVKNKVHRRPILGKSDQCTYHTLLTGMAQ